MVSALEKSDRRSPKKDEKNQGVNVGITRVKKKERNRSRWRRRME